MLEIFLLIGICKAQGNQLRRKHWNPLALQIFQVLTWFCGELFGALTGTVIFVVINPDQPPPVWVTYGSAIFGGLISVAMCFAIASLLPDRSPAFAASSPPGGALTGSSPRIGSAAALQESGNPYAVFDSGPAVPSARAPLAEHWPAGSRYTSAAGYGPLRPYAPDELASASFYKVRVNRLSFASINRFTGNLFFRLVLYIARMFRLPLPADNIATVTTQLVEVNPEEILPAVMASLERVIVESMQGNCSEDAVFATIPTLGMHDLYYFAAPASDSIGFLLAVFHRATFGVETTILDVGVFAKISDDQWVGVKRRATQGIIFGSHIANRRVSANMSLGRMFEELKKDLAKYPARSVLVDGTNVMNLVSEMSARADRELIETGVLVPLPQAKVDSLLAEAVGPETT